MIYDVWNWWVYGVFLVEKGEINEHMCLYSIYVVTSQTWCLLWIYSHNSVRTQMWVWLKMEGGQHKNFTGAPLWSTRFFLGNQCWETPLDADVDLDPGPKGLCQNPCIIEFLRPLLNKKQKVFQVSIYTYVYYIYNYIYIYMLMLLWK